MRNVRVIRVILFSYSVFTLYISYLRVLKGTAPCNCALSAVPIKTGRFRKKRKKEKPRRFDNATTGRRESDPRASGSLKASSRKSTMKCSEGRGCLPRDRRDGREREGGRGETAKSGGSLRKVVLFFFFFFFFVTRTDYKESKGLRTPLRSFSGRTANRSKVR